jgi:hypothetical protein
LAQSGDEALATQAVATMGALELENESLVPLILSGEQTSLPTASGN